ncbi:MAG: LysM peptidoglycan-binding domain-containing protein [Deltaproteobacteria bacterium]|uniref:LysM peptidoglycan-binding domain-containing protein n=1 Tax=Candidatus Zymogenus saltonus TaxID=2844893 RepID=A0A9D8PNM8_9DELT|nr:LysM peptidoglycan-binding domain-containing protein [Candidatus Zymogenus saltonus]
MNKRLILILAILVFLPAIFIFAQDEATTPETTDNENVYTVKAGDTLSSIAQSYLGSASKWRDLWELNPQIKDPNKLTVGQKIILSKAKEEEIKPTEAPSTPTPETETVDGGISEETLTTPEIAPPAMTTVTEKPKEKFTLKPSDYYTIPKVKISGFLSEKDLEDSGYIYRSRHNRKMITDDNIVFIRLPKDKMVKLKPNDRFSIFRILEKVKHPVTGKKIGYAISVVGDLEVTSLGEDTASAIIVTASDIIKEDDRIIPYEQTDEKVRIVKGEFPVVGYIVYSVMTSRDILEESLLSDDDVVYLDRGYADGVRIGNIFDVLRLNEKYNTRKLTAEEYEKMLQKGGDEDSRSVVYPPDIIGRVVVINVGEYTSTAVINSANDVIHLGDMVRLQIE